MNLRRLILTLYLLLLGAAGAAAAVCLHNAWEVYDRLKAVEAVDQRRLNAAETKLSAQEQELARLRTDPAYVERVIRRNLDYARPDDYIFIFEGNP